MKIFIAGGTTGMGFAIAIQYLKDGHNVAICGRDLSKLTLSENSPLLKTYQLDVYDKNRFEEAVYDFAENKLDIMIFSAGSYADDSLYDIEYKQSSDMLRINIAGAINALEIARCAMQIQAKGHIAIIASVSGLLDYPNATTYSRTKIALIQIAKAYRKALRNFGITVTVIAPGYVNTKKLQEINDGDLSKKPFVVDTNYAAKEIIAGIQAKKELVVFPNKMKNLIYFMSYLPSWMVTFIMTQKAKWYHKK